MADLEKDLENEELEDNLNEENASEETKNEKFKRLSAQRIQKAAKYISALGNLANKSSYDYTEEDIDKVFTYLQKQLDDAKAKFDKSNEKEEEFSW
jgi:bifunctional pyridoxal-dependent enzyme with beta-cystathionase and maltose regulon repressor activities